MRRIKIISPSRNKSCSTTKSAEDYYLVTLMWSGAHALNSVSGATEAD